MKYKVSLNGKIYEVEVEKGKALLLDEYEACAPSQSNAAQLSAQPAAAPAPVAAAASSAPAVSGDGEPIASPLPGNVLEIKASAGSSLKKGDVVMIIEAMKMENEILAPKDGVLTAVLVQKGATVETGTVLATIK